MTVEDLNDVSPSSLRYLSVGLDINRILNMKHIISWI